VLSYSPYQSDPVDKIGDVDDDGNLVSPLSFDVLKPGVALFGELPRRREPAALPGQRWCGRDAAS